MRYALTGCVLLAVLALPVPACGDQLPGVWFLDEAAGAADQRRLVVGGTVQDPPASEAAACLGWSWRDPGPDVELYPDADDGTFLAPLATWSLTAGGETVAPETCRPAGTPAPFPGLGLGPADELWLLAPEARQPDTVAPEVRQPDAAPWADLLHTVEAAYRQSTPSPLGAQIIGDLEGCAVRSLPVALDTRLDRWSPLELFAGRASGATLAGRASGATLAERASGAPAPEDGTGDAGGREQLIRTRRFSWWIEPPAPGASCTTAVGRGTLRLFPVPTEAEDTGDAATDRAGGAQKKHLFFLTVAGVDWQRLPFSALDPDDWSPRLRRLLPSPAPDATAAAREISIRPDPEQRQALLAGRALDLCAVAGLDQLCARNARARRQLYTAIARPDAEIPWPEEHLLAAREACRAALADAVSEATAACTTPELWQRPIAGALVAGFSGEVLLTEGPVIRETWHDGTVEWRLDTGGGDPRQALAATPDLELRLLDGTRVPIATKALLDPPATRMARWQWWALGAGALMAFAALGSWLLARRRGAPRLAADAQGREELEQLIEGAVDRRLSALGSLHAPAAPVPGDEPAGGLSAQQVQDLARHAAAEAVAARLTGAGSDLEQHATAHQRRLDGVAQELAQQLEQSLAALGEELRESLRHEAQSLSQGLSQDLGTSASPFQLLSRELAELPEKQRQPVMTALAALGRLGDWIDRLWPVLQAVAGRDLDSIPQDLSDPAAGEWRRAVQALDAFCRWDAAVFRRLGSGVPPKGDQREVRPLEDAADPLAIAVFEDAGLFAAERPVDERLKRHLEPFDQIGRLGEVTLALQYLVEAFPIEQLSKDQRSRFRRELVQAQRAAGLEEDFHQLVTRVAAGIGLRYRPVRYYKSRTDQSEDAFVRQQVSPISLSERVGFDATTDKALIVRLERPFFFQLDTGIYYTGHAHVAR